MENLVYLHNESSFASIEAGQLSAYENHQKYSQVLLRDGTLHVAYCIYDDNSDFYSRAAFEIPKAIFPAANIDALISFPASLLTHLDEFSHLRAAIETLPCLYDETGTSDKEAIFSPGSLCLVSLPRARTALFMRCDPKSEVEKAVYARSCYKHLSDIFYEHIPGFSGFSSQYQPKYMMQAVSVCHESNDVLCAYEQYCCDAKDVLRADTSVVPSDQALLCLSGAADRAKACFAIWESALNGCFVFPPSLRDKAAANLIYYMALADMLGVMPMLDAYYAGVPIEDVLGNAS